ncbi:YCF48-related protein [Pseudomonas sp. NBRC 100443]|uniref:WD40/YVTN/BNR-like repeat-containing protein n=1 Tax=Pseudomonas sp. NBRC 100443 TaxID=1113665 RepID=UPI0025556F80|nr:YCF48-related protein [Pseudomonas sp. NBRC 100443]
MSAVATLHSFFLSRIFLRGLFLAALYLATPLAQAFESPLEVPAMKSDRYSTSPMQAVARAGNRLVVVGLRGAILYSDDQGRNWTQADVPVSVDLVAVTFVGAKKGWAVGHGGVVLHSDDAGASWVKQLDGLQASKLAMDYYSARVGSLQGASDYLAKEQRLSNGNETQPFLDVYFADEKRGYVVGTFNRIFMTQDGGRNWEPQMHLTNNAQEWHFYSVSGNGTQVYLSGEQGHVWRWDTVAGHFLSIDTPYNGTLFGVLSVDGDDLYAFGMRGSFFHSTDAGRTWERLTLPTGGSLMRILLTEDRRLLVVSQSGEVSLGEPGAHAFKLLSLAGPMPYYGAALLDGHHLVLVGALGVRIESL